MQWCATHKPHIEKKRKKPPLKIDLGAWVHVWTHRRWDRGKFPKEMEWL